MRTPSTLSTANGAPNAGPLLSSGRAAHPPGLTTAMWRAGDNVWNIGYTLSGTVREILPQGETWEHPHDFMLLKPGGAHRWEVPRAAREPWSVVWFTFVPKPDWLPLLDLPEEFPRFSRLSLAGRLHDGKIRRALLQAHRFACSPAGGQGLAMNAIERALLWLQVEFADRNARLEPRVRAAMELFTRRLSEPPSIPAAAAACGLSVSRLGELFLAGTGQTPRTWLEQARLNYARDLLRTTAWPVKFVAAACGYRDQRHFATRFRKRFAATPVDCRRQEALSPAGGKPRRGLGHAGAPHPL
jgi:AraC family transcriptional regulator, arabinose operon regulatory protein